MALEKHHPIRAKTLHDIAECLSSQEIHATAQTKLNECRATRERELGMNIRDHAKKMIGLAECLYWLKMSQTTF